MATLPIPEGMFRIEGYDFNITSFDSMAEAEEAADVYLDEEGDRYPVSANAEVLNGHFVVKVRKFPGYIPFYL